MQGAVNVRDIFTIRDKKGVAVLAVPALRRAFDDTVAAEYHLLCLSPYEQHKCQDLRIAKPAEAGA